MRWVLLIAVLGLVLAAAPAAAGAATPDTPCTIVAAPGGSDSAAGTEAAPFATAQKVATSLGPGQVGCLRAGTYSENVTIRDGGSSDDARAILRSYPGERATIDGRVYVADSANWVTVERLDLDGHNAPGCNPAPTCVLPSPTVNGDHVVFQDNDVTNRHRGICFNLGNYTYGRALDDVIQRNRIHDCGNLPADNHEHGIYLSYADRTQILDNLIYDNADRGIQLYPDAQATLIRGNVIDGNGEGVIFSGGSDVASNGNVVEHNVITNSVIRHDVESWYPGPAGSGNVVRDNCVHGGAQGTIAKPYGFTVGANIDADPRYLDRAAKDFRLAADSPCAGLIGDAGPAPEPVTIAPEALDPAPEANPQPPSTGSDPLEGSAPSDPTAVVVPDLSQVDPQPGPDPAPVVEVPAPVEPAGDAASAATEEPAAGPPVLSPEPQTAQADPEPVQADPQPPADPQPVQADPQPSQAEPEAATDPEPDPPAQQPTGTSSQKTAVLPHKVLASPHALADRILPSIVVATPRAGARYKQGAKVRVAYSCADNVLVATCAGDMAAGRRLATKKPGKKRFTVTARDAAGNAVERVVKYVVKPKRKAKRRR